MIVNAMVYEIRQSRPAVIAYTEDKGIEYIPYAHMPIEDWVASLEDNDLNIYVIRQTTDGHGKLYNAYGSAAQKLHMRKMPNTIYYDNGDNIIDIMDADTMNVAKAEFKPIMFNEVIKHLLKQGMLIKVIEDL